MPTFVASTNTTSAAAFTMPITLPTHSEGDVIILSFVHDYNSDAQTLTSVSEGYTELADLSIAGLAHQGAVWYKVAGASESSPTATYSLDSQEMACQASSYSGVDSVTPIDTGPSLWNTEDPGDTSVESPSITTVTDGALMVSVATADENDTFTQPAGMTLVGNLIHVNMVIASAYETIASAGATGVRTWNFAQNTDEITAVSFALRPAVSSGVTITVDSGSYSLTGTDANLKAQLSIATTSGSYLLTGSQVNLNTARQLLVSVGSYTLTGTDVTLTYTPGGGGEVLIIDSGTYSLSGDEVILRAELSLVANSGDYQLSGNDTPILFNGNVSANTESYALTGSSLNTFANYGMIAQSASYSLTGVSVILSYSGDISQVVGVVTAGFAVDLYSAGFALDLYSTRFKPNTITVTFKG